MILVATERFLYGGVFYKDFSILYTPGIYVYTALAFKLFGVSLYAATISWSVIRALNCLLIYLVGIEFVSRRAAFVLPLLLWLIPGDPHKGFFVFCVLLSILILVKLRYLQSNRFYFLAGLAVGVILLFRVDICGFFVTGFFIVQMARTTKYAKAVFDSTEINVSLKNILIFICGSAVSVAPLLLYLLFHDALAEAFRQTMDYTAAMKSVWFYLLPMKQLLSFDLLAIYKFIGLTLPFIFYLLVFILLALIIIKREINDKDIKLFIVFLFGCLTLNQAISYPGISRINQILPPVLIADVYLISRYFSNSIGKPSPKTGLAYRAGLIGLNLLLAVNIIASCSISDPYINGSIFMRVFNRTFLSDPKLKVYTKEKYADEFNKVVDAIKKTTQEGEYVFTFPNNSQMFNFVTGRRALEKYASIPEYMKSTKRQEEVMRLLEEKNVRLIISDLSETGKRTLWAPVLDQYIMEHYGPTQKIGSFTLLVRK
ncbi:MAG: hypothetical protein HY761_04915 [Candidatus Omnitrophica bacterium]|nr:hypothetical protein [Candidatus Omnitrophota bacterium]